MATRRIRTAEDGDTALDVLSSAPIDAIVCDVMMPRMDGFTMIGLLRQMGNMTPTLIITAQDSMADKKTGFQKGTDDYMVKPINVNEMVWRVEALLRRSRIGMQHRSRIGNTEFDADTLSMHTEQGKGNIAEIQLLLKEFQLMEDIWESDGSDTHTLDVHISRLRERFRNNPDFEIVTIRGLGYKAVQRERA